MHQNKTHLVIDVQVIGLALGAEMLGVFVHCEVDLFVKPIYQN